LHLSRSIKEPLKALANHNAGWVGGRQPALGRYASEEEDACVVGPATETNYLMCFTQSRWDGRMPLSKPRSGVVQSAALLEWHYQTPIGTPPSDTEERSTLSCPMFEGTGWVYMRFWKGGCSLWEVRFYGDIRLEEQWTLFWKWLV